MYDVAGSDGTGPEAEKEVILGELEVRKNGRVPYIIKMNNEGGEK